MSRDLLRFLARQRKGESASKRSFCVLAILAFCPTASLELLAWETPHMFVLLRSLDPCDKGKDYLARLKTKAVEERGSLSAVLCGTANHRRLCGVRPLNMPRTGDVLTTQPFKGHGGRFAETDTIAPWDYDNGHVWEEGASLAQECIRRTNQRWSWLLSE